MEVQIFGHKKDAATRAAQRFFAERRVKVHFVDFMDRWPSKGELQRFARSSAPRRSSTARASGSPSAGWGRRATGGALARRAGRRPVALRVPLVRWQHKITVGAAEAEWKGWVEADKKGA
jgi:arsenate reductase-like glutaredoxin family protein